MEKYYHIFIFFATMTLVGFITWGVGSIVERLDTIIRLLKGEGERSHDG